MTMNPIAEASDSSGVVSIMPPDAMCGILKTAESRTACVPFPAPGGPNNRRFSLKFYRPLLRLLTC